MRDENQTHGDAQHEGRSVQGPLSHVSDVLAPVSLFVSVYLATFVTSGLLLRAYVQWAALLSCTVATCSAVIVWDGRRFAIGFVVPPRLALSELAKGIGFAALIVATVDAFIVLFSSIRQTWTGGFPARDLLAVFVPAAFHEEVLFRGYVYQKIRRWGRGLAIAISSTVFALLHAGNEGVSSLAMINIAIAGVLLALAYERYRRLWFPIGIHFAWNLLSGPILGFPVSGFVPRASLMHVTGSGTTLVTGGPFGIESSAFMTAVEITAVLALWALERRRNGA